MKKVISVLLVITVLLSLGVTAMAAGSPVKKDTGRPGIGLYNSEDKQIAFVPNSAIPKVRAGGADKLDAADKDAFLAAYEEAKNTEGKVVRDFFWLDVADEYKNLDGFSYAKYYFGSRGQNVQVTVNGKDMEVVRLGHGQYYAKLTEFVIVSITSD